MVEHLLHYPMVEGSSPAPEKLAKSHSNLLRYRKIYDREIFYDSQHFIFFVTSNGPNKLECLSLAILSSLA